MQNIKVITVASGKGGTGKTTTTANLGIALAALNRQTIILDADIAMANLALLLGMEKIDVTLHEVLAGEKDIKDAIYHGPKGVMVVPCGISLAGFQKSHPEKLQEVLMDLLGEAEFLFIDAPAGLGKDSIIPMAIADEILLVLNPEVSSVSDGLKIKIMADTIETSVRGIILNRVRRMEGEIGRDKVEKIFNLKVLAEIPEDTSVIDSVAKRRPVILTKPNSSAAMAYRKLAADLVGEKFEFKKENIVKRFISSIFGR
ncbi:MAG: cell division ATPase MinD [Methanomicrobia archaeon]|nr:cell division ATPase MinD [Methanomicrobia archaeon]RLF92118.1 MAG: septum site-determining protein MinD [Thermococci archaeon]